MLSRRTILAAMAALPLSTACKIGNSNVFNIGLVTFPGYAPFYLAEKLALFGDTKVNLLRIESIGDLRSALLAGRIDAYLATFDIYQAIEGREPVGKIIYGIDESFGADGIVTAPGISTIDDFRGKKVGVEPGFPPHFVLTYALYKAGLKLSDLEVIDMPSGDVPSAFASGQIDIAATYEPFLSNCLSTVEGASLVLSSADTPGLITDFIVASERALKEKPTQIADVISGWEAALKEIQSNPSVSYEIMGSAFGFPAEEMAEFATVVNWLGKAENLKLFENGSDSTAHVRFREVNEALVLNNPQNHISNPESSFELQFISS